MNIVSLIAIVISAFAGATLDALGMSNTTCVVVAIAFAVAIMEIGK